MPEDPRQLDYATPRSRVFSRVMWARIAVAVIGIALPFLARLPGIPSHGIEWLTSCFGNGLVAFVILGAFNAILWLPMLIASLWLRSVPAILISSVGAFAYAFYQHMRLDLSSDAQAAVGLVLIPLYAFPFAAIGWVLGLLVDLFWFDGPGQRGRRNV